MALDMALTILPMTAVARAEADAFDASVTHHHTTDAKASAQFIENSMEVPHGQACVGAFLHDELAAVHSDDSAATQLYDAAPSPATTDDEGEEQQQEEEPEEEEEPPAKRRLEPKLRRAAAKRVRFTV